MCCTIILGGGVGVHEVCAADGTPKSTDINICTIPAVTKDGKPVVVSRKPIGSNARLGPVGSFTLMIPTSVVKRGKLLTAIMPSTVLFSKSKDMRVENF